jgi:hypothetical protein
MTYSYGVNYSWGTFLRNYNQNVYVGEMTKLSWIGSICIALYFIIGPINEWVVRKLGYTKMLAFATIMCPLALMLASISHEVFINIYTISSKYSLLSPILIDLAVIFDTRCHVWYWRLFCLVSVY